MRAHRALEARSLFIVYGGLFTISCIGDFTVHGEFLASWRQGEGPTLLGFFGIAFVLLIYVGIYTLGTKLFSWMQEFERVLRQILSPISDMQILVLSFLSGFMEEWFFRGLLMNSFGIVVSSLAFALAHFIPATSLWIPSLATFFAGFALAYFYKMTGSLLLVALLHSFANLFLLYRVNRAAHGRPAIS